MTVEGSIGPVNQSIVTIDSHCKVASFSPVVRFSCSLANSWNSSSAVRFAYCTVCGNWKRARSMTSPGLAHFTFIGLFGYADGFPQLSVIYGYVGDWMFPAWEPGE